MIILPPKSGGKKFSAENVRKIRLLFIFFDTRYKYRPKSPTKYRMKLQN
jgi:hypothetical protein